MRKYFRNRFNRLFGGFARKEDLSSVYDQVTAFIQLREHICSKTILGPLRGWAISPDAMLCVIAELEQRTSPAVVEFGSGQSTIIFGSYLKRRQGGRIISFEHDDAYAEKIRVKVKSYGLEEFVEIRHIKVRRIKEPKLGEEIESYDLSDLPHDISVDVALVDGPPYTFGHLTRFTPVLWSLQHLRKGGRVFLDDANRLSEKDVIELVARVYPSLETESYQTEKGLVSLRIEASGS